MKKYSKEQIRAAFKQWAISEEKGLHDLMSREEANKLSHDEYADLCADFIVELMEDPKPATV